ncbi:hypothetical protein QJQ45_024721 [Haematococcus lacustris]|nr:hypothetical protein QJQ45_024721 [Haematococcus lacustris]
MMANAQPVNNGTWVRASLHSHIQGHSCSGVFQSSSLQGQGPELGLLDVRDAVEACSTASSKHARQQCFLTFGLDADKVDNYYEPVLQLEQSLDQGDEVGRRLARCGSLLFSLLLASRLV